MDAQDDDNLILGEESDEDFDWEEVDVPQAEPQLDLSLEDDIEKAPSIFDRPNIEITIQSRKKAEDTVAKERAAAIRAARVARLDAHKIHTICLIANARVRNQWLNDPLLHARLMSLTPISHQNSFSMIHKSRVPESARRGRLFEAAITRLAEWWSSTFKIEYTGHIRSRTFEEVQRELQKDVKGKGKAEVIDEDEDEVEVIRSEKSLMKHALLRRGSRDTSAQLFTALCRALGIPARLVVSLQSVPWQAGVGKPKPTTKKKVKTKGKGKAKASTPVEESNDEDDESNMEEVDISGVSTPSVVNKGKGKASSLPSGSNTPSPTNKGKRKAPPVIKLRGSTTKKSSSKPKETLPQVLHSPDPTTTPPVFWTEVFSKADARWLPVDPIRCIINKRKVFDPSRPSTAPNRVDRSIRIENRMVYVVAFEEDGYARDVTPRYAREFGAKVAKMQHGGKGRQQWWERIMGIVHRPYRLNRDDLEDEELHVNQMTEQMPTSMAGFKNHPLYVLARHLKRDEVIHPQVELGKFRGEPVYPRSSVVSLKTAENWMRQGRKVREGCQPMKWVKQRAVTVNKKRAIKMAMEDLAVAGEGGMGSEKDVMQGLYAVGQTELYVPDPVIDGKVPKNDFGNIDLYVPSMLPTGAAYVPHKGTAKIARELGFDYAEAVVAFEFRKGRAFPIISGVVVAAENEIMLLEAYWEAEQHAESKRRAKREEQVLKRWTRLVQGLRIRQRLQNQYADHRGPSQVVENNDADAAATGGRGNGGDSGDKDLDEEDGPVAGGFLTGADDVVQPYTLPRNLHEVLPSSSKLLSPPPPPPSRFSLATKYEDDKPPMENHPSSSTNPEILEIIDDSEDEQQQLLEIPVVPITEPSRLMGVPKTMRELAQDMADKAEEIISGSEGELELELKLPPTPSSSKNPPHTNGQSTHTTRKQQQSDTNRKSRTTTTTTTYNSTKPNTRQASKKRRRTTDVDSSDQEAPSIPIAPPPLPSSSSSSRKRRKPNKAVEPVVKSDRVLRTRTPKNASKVQEEREMEEAFRRATTE